MSISYTTYTVETLRQFNFGRFWDTPAVHYRQAPCVGEWEVNQANAICARLEALHLVEHPIPLDGDILICVSPTKGVVAENGHLQTNVYGADSMAVCTHAYTPFILPKSLKTDASGGYWPDITEEVTTGQLTYVGRRAKRLTMWDHLGPRASGAFSFAATVNVWRLESPKFYLAAKDLF